MVICLNCHALIPFEKGYGALGHTHLSFRFEGYPINSFYKSNAKKIYGPEKAFEVCCKQCFVKGKYFDRLIALYPNHLGSAHRSKEQQKEANKLKQEANKLKQETNKLKQEVKGLKKELGRYKTDLSVSRSKLTSVSKQVDRHTQLDKERRERQRVSKEKIMTQRKEAKLHTIFAFQSDINKKLLATFTRSIVHLAAKFAQGNPSFKELFNKTQEKILQTLLFDYMQQIINFSRYELSNFNTMAVSISEDINKIKQVRERCITEMESIFSKLEINRVSGIFDLQIEEKVNKISQSDSYTQGCERVVAQLELLVKNRGLYPINQLVSTGLTQSSSFSLQAEAAQNKKSYPPSNPFLNKPWQKGGSFNESYPQQFISRNGQNANLSTSLSQSNIPASSLPSFNSPNNTSVTAVISQNNPSTLPPRNGLYDPFRKSNANGAFLMPNDLHKS